MNKNKYDVIGILTLIEKAINESEFMAYNINGTEIDNPICVMFTDHLREIIADIAMDYGFYMRRK